MCLGIALARLDDPDNAAAAYNKALSMDATEPLFHLNYGERAQGLQASACSKQQALLRLQWRACCCHLHAALMLHSHGDADGARQQLAGCSRLVAGLDEPARAALDPELLAQARALEQQLGAAATAAAGDGSGV